MLFKRQKLLLALLSAAGGRADRRDFQKLLLLYCQEREEAPSYEFVPHRFGAFSFTSHHDMRKLAERALVAKGDGAWLLCPAGAALAGQSGLCSQTAALLRRYEGVRGDALIAESYRRYPWYATRSQVTDAVLADDRQALSAIERAKPAPPRPGLCTIGYEGRSLEGYLATLLKAGVTLLCDVRRNPLSRKYGFSKRVLTETCAEMGIRYEHVPALGIDGAARKGLHSQADYDALFASFAREQLPRRGREVDMIWDWIGAGECVALTCFEKKQQQCHRKCVSDELARLHGDGLKVRHL